MIGDTSQKVVYELQMQGVPAFVADAKAAAGSLDTLKRSTAEADVALTRAQQMGATKGGPATQALWASMLASSAPAGSRSAAAAKAAGFTEAEIGATAAGAGAARGAGLAGLAGGAARLGAAGAIAGAGYVALNQLKDGVRYATESQRVNLQVQAAIKSTGGAAGVTSKQVRGLASSIGNLSGQQRNTVLSSESVLLGFNRIKNVGTDKIFDRTALAVANVSARLGTDLNTSALQVGKALQEPISGIGALRSAGVLFTAQQVDQVKVMVAAGDRIGAQKILLGQLERQYGGAAKASGKDLPAALTRLDQAWEDSRQKLVVQLMPGLITFTNWLAITLPKATAIASTAIHGIWGNGPGSISGFLHGLPGGSVAGGAFDFAKQPIWTQAGQVNSALNNATQGVSDNLFGSSGATVTKFAKGRGLHASDSDDDDPALGLGSPFRTPPVKVNWAGGDPLSNRPIVLVADGKQLASVVMRGSAKAAHAQGRGSAHR